MTSLNALIREHVKRAADSQAKRRAFALWGRGHEPRVTLDPRMAAVLRGVELPRVTISGFGANNFYPARVFAEASVSLQDHLGWSPFVIASDSSVCAVELPSAGEERGRAAG